MMLLRVFNQFQQEGGKSDQHGGRGPVDSVELQHGSNPAPRNMDQLPVDKTRVPAVADDPPDYLIKVEYKRFKTSLDRPVEDQ